MMRRRIGAGIAPRVVLDTNVVLSALVFAGGVPSDLRRAWQSGALRPLISAATAAELIRVLAYPKFRLAALEQEELLADYLPYAEVIGIPVPPPQTPPCRDPFDTPFLELAVAGRAQALISGDADLLVLRTQMPCMVVSPAEFLEFLKTK